MAGTDQQYQNHINSSVQGDTSSTRKRVKSCMSFVVHKMICNRLFKENNNNNNNNNNNKQKLKNLKAFNSGSELEIFEFKNLLIWM